MSTSPHVISLKVPPPEPPKDVLPPVPSKKSYSYTKWYMLLGLLFVIVVGWSVVHFQIIQKLPSLSDTPTDASAGDASKEKVEKEANDLVAEVGALILLPVGEVPTIATVSDPDKLKDQSFFQNAKVGDKALLYTKARRAYLYRPSQRLLIEVAPITEGN